MANFDPAIAGLDSVSALTASGWIPFEPPFFAPIADTSEVRQFKPWTDEVTADYAEDITGVGNLMVFDLSLDPSVLPMYIFFEYLDPDFSNYAPTEGPGFNDPLNPCTGGSGGTRPDEGLLYPRGDG